LRFRRGVIGDLIVGKGVSRGDVLAGRSVIFP
jgi:hypothetical protein